MAKYRKKPVVVDAYQTDTDLVIETLEGIMQARKGDWIITGVNGEKYPCKPDIFEATYELVFMVANSGYEVDDGKKEPFLFNEEMWLDLKGLCGVDPIEELQELIGEAEAAGEEVYIERKLAVKWVKNGDLP
jgi:hypothetical protein